MIQPDIRIVDEEIEPTPGGGDGTGAVVEFSGIVRENEDAMGIVGDPQPITGIDYEVFRDMALAELRRIAIELIERYTLSECVCIHRGGFVPAGQAAVYIRTAAQHRREAFDANMEFIELLKLRVPIWKHPVFNRESGIRYQVSGIRSQE